MAARAPSLDAHAIRTCMLRIEDNCPIQDGGEFVNVACNRSHGVGYDERGRCSAILTESNSPRLISLAESDEKKIRD
jgi:hypothetical protein